jgi:hypothetical protein
MLNKIKGEPGIPAFIAIAAFVAWVIYSSFGGPPTGYVGRDGQYDVYCGYKPDGTGSANYDCERTPAVYLNRPDPWAAYNPQ